MDGQYGNVKFICSATDTDRPKELYDELAPLLSAEDARREKIEELFSQVPHARRLRTTDTRRPISVRFAPPPALRAALPVP